MKIRTFGVVPYREARELQESLVRERISGSIEDTLLVLQHPPTLTLGRRMRAGAAELCPEVWRERGVEVVHASRGGEATYHGPGQLVVYPVVSLVDRRLGVRRFVEAGLRAIGDVAESFGVSSEVKMDPAGLWTVPGGKKLASVGLRIERGVTDHGFSFNICCDLSHFLQFPVCGQSGTVVTSLQEERGVADFSDAQDRTIQSFLKGLP